MDKNWFILFCILCAIGLFFDVVNIGVYITDKKDKNAHVSGVPFIGAVFFCAALLTLKVTRPFFILGIFADVTVYSIPWLIAYNLKAYKYRNRFRIVVLTENTVPDEESGLKSEHGLSLYIEQGAHTFLLDAGQSEVFAENAEKLKVDLTKVEAAILSHGHYDHADGFDKFLSLNKKAKLYMRREVGEQCFSERPEGITYIGPKKGMLEEYKKRIEKIDGKFYPLLSWSAVLIPHTSENLEAIGEKTKLFKETEGKMQPDDFNHEQTLIMFTPKGIVICNSCSHAGVKNIIKEARDYLCRDDEIYAYIGGFHLMKADDEEVRSFAKELKNANVKRFITGHCTGERAIEILREELGDCVEEMHVGTVIE